MHDANVAEVLARIAPNDLVLDVGGWARPFNRADIVMDAEPYETRGYYRDRAAQGGEIERFTQETWIRRDICEHTPFPFGDKEIDFVICSHTLEDVRDPLWVCAEMVRVAKRGYLEVPSRIAESCRGVEPGQVGWSHHRWLVDIVGDHVQFLMKYHMIHSHWRFSLPERHLRQLRDQQLVQWLFWDGSFSYSERTIHGTEAIAEELGRFVGAVRPYPKWLVGLDRAARWPVAMGRRAARRLRRRIQRRGEDRG